MKVLMINCVCGILSTGRICTDLAVALEKEGHEVKIAYGRDSVPKQFEKYAIRIGTKWDVYMHAAKARLMDADGLGSIQATKKFINWVEKYNPDVIHLHNLHGYYINIPILFNYIIQNKKKVLWTLHDCWTFTGHSGTCALVKCEKWLSGCGRCPLKSDYPKSYVDKSKYNFRWKKKLFTAVEDLTIIPPSNWLAGLVKRSFFSDKIIEVIPNGIDTTQFKPLQNDFRKVYNVEDKVVLLGCVKSGEKEEGLDDFIRLSQELDDKFRIVLLGDMKKQIVNIPETIIYIEQTKSVKELTQIYSSADLFLNLSCVDACSMVNRKVLAAGTPVLTYDVGECKAFINQNNGRVFRTGDLDGIISFLQNEYKTNVFDDFVYNHDETIEKHGNVFDEGGYFASRLKYNLFGKNMVLGVASRWGNQKGLMTFVRLAKELPQEFDIYMVGNTSDVKNQIPDRVHIIDSTNSIEELRELYAVADVFVNPTLQDNYPTVNMEAVACNTPVITYRTGGSP